MPLRTNCDGTPISCPGSNDTSDEDDNTPTEEVTSAAGENSLRPAADGACQLATFSADQPSLEALAISTLDPASLYDVLGAVIIDEQVWYRVEQGWVAPWVVVVDGNCPVVLRKAIDASSSIREAPIIRGGEGLLHD